MAFTFLVLKFCIQLNSEKKVNDVETNKGPTHFFFGGGGEKNGKSSMCAPKLQLFIIVNELPCIAKNLYPSPTHQQKEGGLERKVN